MYTGHSIETNGELSYDISLDTLNRWQMWVNEGVRLAGWFFRGRSGRIAAVVIFAAALALAMVTGGIAGGAAGAIKAGAVAGTGMAVGLGIGAVMCGVRAAAGGDCFWEGFSGFIREDWAVSVAITSMVVMPVVGIKLGGAVAAKAGMSKVGASKTGVGGVSGKTGLPNGVGPHGPTHVIGKAHASAEHIAEINRITIKLVSSGEYDKIWLNRALKTAGLVGTNQPDIIGLGFDGKFRIIEVASKTQLKGKFGGEQLVKRVINMQRDNPTAIFDPINWLFG